MTCVENKERNDEIYAASKPGGGKLSIRELMKKFGFKSPSTVFNILRVVERRRSRGIVH